MAGGSLRATVPFRRLPLAGLVACLLAAGLVAAACSNGVASIAFSVNGRETSQSDFDRELDALADNDGFIELYEGLGGPVRNSEGTVSSQLAAEWATLVIQQEILGGAVDDQGIEVTDEDRTTAEAEAINLFGAEQQGESVWTAFPDWFRERVLDRLAAQVAFVRASESGPTDEEVQEFYDANVDAIVEECPSGKFISHILVESDAEANDVLAQLDAGAEFAELAREQSTDPTAQAAAGFLDCFREGAYVAEFEAAVAEAAVGAMVGPVETEFGWHVILVEARPPLEGVRAQIAEALAGRAQQEAFQEILDNADVELDSRYGTWVVDEAGARVQPPEAERPDPPDEDPELPELDLPAPQQPAPAP
jgi:parvulin-like peptidyl-prolyl isomerase